MPAPDRPVPVPDELTRPFWEAAQQGRLVIQRCDECGHYAHPPAHVCERCASTALAFTPVSGRGRVHTYTTNYQKSVAGFEEVVPYVNLVVELDEQPLLLMLSDVPGDDAAWVEVGVAVSVTFAPLVEGLTLPQWRPRPGTGQRLQGTGRKGMRGHGEVGLPPSAGRVQRALTVPGGGRPSLLRGGEDPVGARRTRPPVPADRHGRVADVAMRESALNATTPGVSVPRRPLVKPSKTPSEKVHVAG